MNDFLYLSKKDLDITKPSPFTLYYIEVPLYRLNKPDAGLSLIFHVAGYVYSAGSRP